MIRATARLAAAPAALAATLAAGAALAQSDVQIYGLLTPMVDHVSVSGAKAGAPAARPSMLAAAAYNGRGNGRITRMQSSTSGLGFRGSEDLGGGLKAIFQLETGVQVDDGTVTGSATAPGRFWSRNSRVGLSGAFGTVFAGIWDMPIAWSHLGQTNGVRNPYAGDSSLVFVTPGFNLPSSVTADGRGNGPGDAIFNRRQGNTLQYVSPDRGGFNLRLAYALPEGERTAANGARTAPRQWGLGAEYVDERWFVRYAYQRHDDYFGLAWLGAGGAANPDVAGSTATGSKDDNHRLIVRYQFTPAWSLQGTWDRLAYRADGVAAGRVEAYRRDAWAALLRWRTGPHTAWLNVGAAGDGHCGVAGGGACRSDGLGARMAALGWRYDFSRRTDVFVSAYELRNRANGQYGVFPRSVAGIAPGSRQRALTLGIEHSF